MWHDAATNPDNNGCVDEVSEFKLPIIAIMIKLHGWMPFAERQDHKKDVRAPGRENGACL